LAIRQVDIWRSGSRLGLRFEPRASFIARIQFPFMRPCRLLASSIFVKATTNHSVREPSRPLSAEPRTLIRTVIPRGRRLTYSLYVFTQVLIHGTDDRIVPVSMGRAYCAAATAKGDKAELIELDATGHFELVSPGAEQGKKVVETVSGLL